MTAPTEKQMATQRGWAAGVDNLSEEQALTTDDRGHVIALRESENVDLDRAGKISRRQGFKKVVSGTDVHSLWADPNFPLALYVDQGDLMALQRDFGTFSVRDGLMPGQPASYAVAAGRVYWSNSFEAGAVSEDGAATAWGIAGPAGQPVLSASDGIGGLDAGTYQVAVTFVAATGEESGTPRAATVDVATGGGITLTAIPQPVDVTQRIRVYRSGARGGGASNAGTATLLYHATDVPAGTTTLLLGVGRLGKPLTTQFLEPMPPGHIVRHFAGRLWVARDNTVVHSAPLHYGQTHLPQNRISLSAHIDLLEPVGGSEAGGLFVAAGDRTYWLGGTDPAAMHADFRYPDGGGAVPGTAVRVAGTALGLETSDPVVYWLARNGVGCIGLPGGVVMPLREAQAVAPSAESGASVFRKQRGMHQIVTTLQGASRRGVAVGDRLDCEVIRHDP